MKLNPACFFGVTLMAALLSSSLSVPAKPPVKKGKSTPTKQRSQNKDKSSTKKSELVKHLETMHVRGDRIKALVVQLRTIKAALNRPLSMDPADADKLVCRIQRQTGSHFKHFLFCGTNRERIKQHDRLRAQLQASRSRSGDGRMHGPIPTVNADYSTAFKVEVDALRLRKLLNMLPAMDNRSSHH